MTSSVHQIRFSVTSYSRGPFLDQAKSNNTSFVEMELSSLSSSNNRMEEKRALLMPRYTPNIEVLQL